MLGIFEPLSNEMGSIPFGLELLSLSRLTDEAATAARVESGRVAGGPSSSPLCVEEGIAAAALRQPRGEQRLQPDLQLRSAQSPAERSGALLPV